MSPTLLEPIHHNTTDITSITTIPTGKELDGDDMFRNQIYYEFKKLISDSQPNCKIHLISKNDAVYDYKVENKFGKEIADIMRNLNKDGLSDYRIGNIIGNGYYNGSFKYALDKILASFLTLIKKRNIQTVYYIELGGEPIKTSYILDTILTSGLKIAKYICVDINKSVAVQMEEEISTKFPNLATTFVTGNWSDFKIHQHCPLADIPALFTNLGFQETMFEADYILSMIKNIMRPTDYLLSELQIIPQDHQIDEQQQSSILDFYKLPQFQRFSDLTLQSMYPDALHEWINGSRSYQCHLIPVSYRGETVQIAMTTESGKSAKNGSNQICITWYNIKYRMGQWFSFKGLYFKPQVRTLTADKSLLFELAMPLV